jgi:DNA-3-methyladenine glycosylase II
VLAPDAHLHRSDEVMARLIDDFGGPLPEERENRGRPPDVYGALVRSITGQQLSVKAAASIYNRLLERFGGSTPTPEQILADDPDELRIAAGFSRAKVSYLRSLAEHVLSGELEIDRLSELPDEEVIRELTAVKGIGEWTAHMFLMFTLHRPDVLPVGDLGVRNAAMRAYGLDAPPPPPALQEIAEPWRPYRTRASLYLWRSLDNEPV